MAIVKISPEFYSKFRQSEQVRIIPLFDVYTAFQMLRYVASKINVTVIILNVTFIEVIRPLYLHTTHRALHTLNVLGHKHRRTERNGTERRRTEQNGSEIV